MFILLMFLSLKFIIFLTALVSIFDCRLYESPSACIDELPHYVDVNFHRDANDCTTGLAVNGEAM